MGVGKAYNQMNGGSANGDAFVNWHLTTRPIDYWTKFTGGRNCDTYVPSLKSHA